MIDDVLILPLHLIVRYQVLEFVVENVFTIKIILINRYNFSS